MLRLFENRQMRARAVLLVGLVGVLGVLWTHHFTTRSPVAAERARAHIMLQRIFDIEQAHFEELGTYLPIDREKSGEILKLNDAPGQFRYRVVVAPGAFVAYAEADLNANGRAEVWQIDSKDDRPVLKQQD